jgi:hypothetical protein
MLGKTIILAFVMSLATSCSGVVTAANKEDKESIDCSESYIDMRLSGNYTCSQFSIKHGTNNPSGGHFRTFNLFGRSEDGISLSIQANVALDNNSYYDATTTNNVERQIQNFNDATIRGQNWTATRTVGGRRVMLFNDNGRNCFGFHGVGDANKWGLRYFTKGEFCRSVGDAVFSNDQINEILNKIAVRDSAPKIQKILPSPTAPAGSATTDTKPNGTIAKLKELKDAFDQGLINAAEYEAKKKILIDAM